jgi:hypothetical protein
MDAQRQRAVGWSGWLDLFVWQLLIALSAEDEDAAIWGRRGPAQFADADARVAEVAVLMIPSFWLPPKKVFTPVSVMKGNFRLVASFDRTPPLLVRAIQDPLNFWGGLRASRNDYDGCVRAGKNVFVQRGSSEGV